MNTEREEARGNKKTLGDNLAAAMKRFVTRAITKRVAPLEARLTALESPTPTKGERHDQERKARRTRRK